MGPSGRRARQLATELIGALSVEDSAPDHELLRAFAERDIELSSTLRDMLNEHHSHRTERRGCGFTQATRHLATFVNSSRGCQGAELRLFRHAQALERAAEALRGLPALLEREESRLLASMISHLVLSAPEPEVVALSAWPDDLKIGTCPLAEKYFLELADGFVRRKGLVNVLVAPSGEPLLVEKINLGDDHSCISLLPLSLNGVVLPPGSLFGVRYDQQAVQRKGRNLPGQIIAVEQCAGFRFLRLSTLAVSPANRSRAFSAHFEAQLAAGLFAPGEATVAQLRGIAQGQL